LISGDKSSNDFQICKIIVINLRGGGWREGESGRKKEREKRGVQ
jgi:hypothetical protein